MMKLLRRAVAVIAVALSLVLPGTAPPAHAESGGSLPEGELRLPPAHKPPPPRTHVTVRPAPRTPADHLEGRKLPVLHPAHPVLRAAPPHPARHPVPHPPSHPAPHPAPRPDVTLPVAPPPVAPPPGPTHPDVGTVTGLPIPRFAAVRSSQVYMRAGPGFRYPIAWVYRRAGMPVEILREFNVWRLVRTPDGTEGWMHGATLNGKRDFIVADGRHTMHSGPEPADRPVAILEAGVVGRILRCDAGAAWCRVEAGGYRGWLPRTDFWGTLPGEAVRGR